MTPEREAEIRAVIADAATAMDDPEAAEGIALMCDLLAAYDEEVANVQSWTEEARAWRERAEKAERKLAARPEPDEATVEMVALVIWRLECAGTWNADEREHLMNQARAALSAIKEAKNG